MRASSAAACFCLRVARQLSPTTSCMAEHAALEDGAPHPRQGHAPSSGRQSARRRPRRDRTDLPRLRGSTTVKISTGNRARTDPTCAPVRKEASHVTRSRRPHWTIRDRPDGGWIRARSRRAEQARSGRQRWYLQVVRSETVRRVLRRVCIHAKGVAAQNTSWAGEQDRTLAWTWTRKARAGSCASRLSAGYERRIRRR